MKNIAIIFVVLLASLLIIFFLYCKRSMKEKFVGKWEITSQNIQCLNPSIHDIFAGDILVKPGIEFLNDLNKNKKEENITISFFENGKYFQEGREGNPFSGEYKMISDTLILSAEGFLKDKILVKLLTDEKMSLKFPVPDMNHVDHVDIYEYWLDKKN